MCCAARLMADRVNDQFTFLFDDHRRPVGKMFMCAKFNAFIRPLYSLFSSLVNVSMCVVTSTVDHCSLHNGTRWMCDYGLTLPSTHIHTHANSNRNTFIHCANKFKMLERMSMTSSDWAVFRNNADPQNDHGSHYNRIVSCNTMLSFIFCGVPDLSEHSRK